jgi:hypothetical protein
MGQQAPELSKTLRVGNAGRPMRTRTAAVTLFVAGAAGCAAPDRPELDYLPPSGQPAAARSVFLRQQPWLVWGNILDHLQQQGARVTDLDEAAGQLAVVYSGDPQPYVDCGWIVIYEGAELDRLPAAQSDASLRRRHDGEVVTLERELRLDARMNVHVEPYGEDAIVRTDSTYVLTKTISSIDAAEPLHAETIDFQAGESGAFSSGTRCQPNGELERLVFEALPPISLVSRPGSSDSRVSSLGMNKDIGSPQIEQSKLGWNANYRLAF